MAPKIGLHSFAFHPTLVRQPPTQAHQLRFKTIVKIPQPKRLVRWNSANPQRQQPD